MIKRGINYILGYNDDNPGDKTTPISYGPIKKPSDTMMEVLITFPLRSFDIDLTMLEEFMLIIYQPSNINDDRFDKVDDYQESDADYMNKPLVFTQKSSKNHVILDGIHEISFRLELPKGAYVYLHKQKDRLLLNEQDKVTTLGGGRKVNFITPHGGEMSFSDVTPQTISPRQENYYEKKQIITNTTPKQKDTYNQILNGIEDSILQSSGGGKVAT